MEELDRRAYWESDYKEIDDVLDEGFFSSQDFDGDVEDDEFHERDKDSSLLSEL